MAGKGRPLKLTAEMSQTICDTIAAGNFRDVAARSAGVSTRSLRSWLAEGRKQTKGIYFDFLQAVLRAEQEAEIEMVKVVTAAAKQDAKHAEWWLERARPERWGRDSKETKRLKELVLELERRLASGRDPNAPVGPGFLNEPEIKDMLRKMHGWRPDQDQAGEQAGQAAPGDKLDVGRGEEQSTP